LKQKFFTPAPNNYLMMSDFDRATHKPKFHMGIKINNKTDRSLEMPGPGELKLMLGHFIILILLMSLELSVRSDLGIGKAHLYPGPGEYENMPYSEAPAIGFGTQIK